MPLRSEEPGELLPAEKLPPYQAHSGAKHRLLRLTRHQVTLGPAAGWRIYYTGIPLRRCHEWFHLLRCAVPHDAPGPQVGVSTTRASGWSSATDGGRSFRQEYVPVSLPRQS